MLVTRFCALRQDHSGTNHQLARAGPPDFRCARRRKPQLDRLLQADQRNIGDTNSPCTSSVAPHGEAVSSGEWEPCTEVSQHNKKVWREVANSERPLLVSFVT